MSLICNTVSSIPTFPLYFTVCWGSSNPINFLYHLRFLTKDGYYKSSWDFSKNSILSIGGNFSGLTLYCTLWVVNRSLFLIFTNKKSLFSFKVFWIRLEGKFRLRKDQIRMTKMILVRAFVKILTGRAYKLGKCVRGSPILAVFHHSTIFQAKFLESACAQAHTIQAWYNDFQQGWVKIKI